MLRANPAVEYKELLVEMLGGKCANCVAERKNLELDHILPLYQHIESKEHRRKQGELLKLVRNARS